MIELVVKEHLEKVLSVSVCLEKPADPPEKYVFFEKTAGGETDHIRRATIALQSYGASLFEAAELNEEVKAAMDQLVIRNNISKSELNSDYNFTDTTTKRYRYQAVYDIIYMD